MSSIDLFNIGVFGVLILACQKVSKEGTTIFSDYWRTSD
jgi:hypothetical protein